MLFAKLRALLFFLWSFTLALPLFVTMLAMAPFVMLFDKSRLVGDAGSGGGGACRRALAIHTLEALRTSSKKASS